MRNGEDYLLEEVDKSGAHPRRPNDVGTLLPGIDLDLVLCGHSHLSRAGQVPGGPLVVIIMGANKGYSNRAKSGDNASIARRNQSAARAQMEKARSNRKRIKLRRKGKV